MEFEKQFDEKINREIGTIVDKIETNILEYERGNIYYDEYEKEEIIQRKAIQSLLSQSIEEERKRLIKIIEQRYSLSQDINFKGGLAEAINILSDINKGVE